MTDDLEAQAETRRKAADKVVAGIVAGRYDDNLVRFAEAIDARVTADGGPRVRWLVEWDGASITQDQLTLGDGRWIEGEIGRSFESLQPSVVAGHRTVIVACAVARRDEISRGEALAKVDEVPLSEVKVSTREVPVDPLSPSSTSA